MSLWGFQLYLLDLRFTRRDEGGHLIAKTVFFVSHFFSKHKLRKTEELESGRQSIPLTERFYESYSYLMILLQNKKARFDYEISNEYEAGISLLGWEVKSLRTKQGNMASAWVTIKNEEAFLEGLKMVRWEFSQNDQDLTRSRKLLLHKREILKLQQKIKEAGYTLLPLKIFLKQGKIKVLLGLGKGRKRHEKKKYIQEREVKREGLRDLN